MIPGTHLKGPNGMTIQDDKGNIRWKKSFDTVGNGHQVRAIYMVSVNSHPSAFFDLIFISCNT